MASTDANIVPIKNRAYRVSFPIFDNTGSLVSGAAGLDSEISKDGGTFVDCDNEATQIATASGMYFLDLTSSEMNADSVVIIVKTSTTDAKTTPLTLYPRSPNDFGVRQQKVEHIVPTGFAEREGVTSEQITRTTFPDYGAIFSEATESINDDFDGNVLVGSIIIKKDTEEPFIILGGYFFNDTGDTTEKVFGIALDSRFGITEGGTVIIDTNWTGTDLAEATNGNGWTFIVVNANYTYPTNNNTLEIWLEPSILRGTFISESSTSSMTDWTTAEKKQIRDSLGVDGTKVAAAGGDVQQILTDTNEIQGKLPTNFIMGSGVVTNKDDEINAIKAQTDKMNFTGTDIKATLDGELVTIAAASEDSIVDKTWDELQSAHVIAGSFGVFLDAKVSDIKAKTDLLAFSGGFVKARTEDGEKILSLVKYQDSYNMTTLTKTTDRVTKMRRGSTDTKDVDVAYDSNGVIASETVV